MAVLVVEDEEQVRVLAESFLQGEGHTTLSASTMEQTLALLESTEPIDLLFTNLTLHGDPEAGLSLATKAVELRPDLKVLYTGAMGVTDGMIALFVRNSAFLPKPYTVDQLKTMLLVKFGIRNNQSNQMTPDLETGHQSDPDNLSPPDGGHRGGHTRP